MDINVEDADMNGYHVLKSMKIPLYVQNANLHIGISHERIN
jgi:hypothetical protein